LLKISILRPKRALIKSVPPTKEGAIASDRDVQAWRMTRDGGTLSGNSLEIIIKNGIGFIPGGTMFLGR